MNVRSIGTLVRALTLSLLIAVGLSVVGCDSGGSNGDSSNGSPAWVGNWKQTDDSGNAVFALSLSKEQVKTTEKNGCTTQTFPVTNISDDNVITTENEDGEKDKRKVQVLDDGTLKVTIQDGENAGNSMTFQSADDSKTTEEIVGCS